MSRLPINVLFAATGAALLLQSASSAQPDPLTTLNGAFRQAYADARRRVLATADPLILVEGDTAVLVRNGGRREAAINAPAYHALKTIAHIPLAIYVTLTPGDGAVDADRIATLEQLRRLIPPARAAFAASSFPTAVVERQDRIVNRSLALVDDVVTRRAFERTALTAFTREMAPLLMANVDEATRAELDVLHAQVSAWRTQMTPEEWTRLRVVIMAPHMPRDEGATSQYFLRLLGEPREGQRVVYAESLFEEPRALDLLGTHVLDGQVGESFFGEAMRMHRDLLADAAREHVARLLP